MTITSAWRRAHPYRHDYFFQAPLGGDEPALKADEMMSTKEGVRMSTDEMDNGLRTYIPVDESTVPGSSVAFAWGVLPGAMAEAKLSLMRDLDIRWFKESSGLTRDSWVSVDCLGSTGDEKRGGWSVIWLKADLDPRQIAQVIRHEVEHISQFYQYGADLTRVKSTREWCEGVAMRAGIAFRKRMMPTQFEEIQHKAEEVAFRYGQR